MDCDRFRALLDSYLDRELQPAIASDAKEHIQACQSCRMALDARRGLSAVLKMSTAHAFPLPAGLSDSVITQLRPASEPIVLRTRLWRSWVGFGAAIALAAVVGSVLTLLLAAPSDQERLIDNAISAHARSLQVDHLTDIASSNPDVVTAWFRGQDHPVPIVKDLTSAGFSLLGGRLDYLYKHPVAAVVYQHKGRPINLYMWSAEKDGPASVEQITDEGLNLVLWQASGIAFCAISDLGAVDLLTFTTVFASSGEPA